MDGQTLTCDLAGARGSNFTMRDRQTGSQWQQATGEAFAGPLKGKRLTIVPFVITTWGEWRAQHPETLAMVLDPEYLVDYRNKRVSIDSLLFGNGISPGHPTERNPERGALRYDPRLPPRERVIGIEVAGGQKAYPVSQLRKQFALNDQVGSTSVVVFHSAASDTTTAFSRVVRGQTLTFQSARPGTADIVDKETGSRWNAYGECIVGRLKGEKLDPIPPQPSFWFSWAQFFPDTQVFAARAD